MKDSTVDMQNRNAIPPFTRMRKFYDVYHENAQFKRFTFFLRQIFGSQKLPWGASSPLSPPSWLRLIGYRNFTSGLGGHRKFASGLGGHRNFASTLPATRLTKNPNSSNCLNFQIKIHSEVTYAPLLFLGGVIGILHRV